MAKKIPQEEADNEVVMVGVVINSTNILRPQRPTTPPPDRPICVIQEVWGNHQDGTVGPPAASPGAPPHGKQTTSRQEFKILVTILDSNDDGSKWRDFTFLQFILLNYTNLSNNLQMKCNL